MPGKKDPGRFTISLNLEDPIQREVAAAINRQGARRKAQFIVNAISHYIHCPETPTIPLTPSSPADSTDIETVILQILAEKGLLAERQEPLSAPSSAIPAEKVQEVRRQTEELIGEKGLNAMQNTMAAFRRR